MATLSARLLATLLVLTATGCGFHLRGTADLPTQWRPLWIVNNGVDPQLERALRDLLGTGDALAVRSEQARAQLELRGEDISRRVASVNSAGQAFEYALRYRVDFLLTDTRGKALAAPQEIAVTRDVLFNANELLSRGREEERIIADLRRELAAALARRMSHLHPSTPPAP